METIKYITRVLFVPVVFVVLFFRRLELERRLWVIRHRAGILIRWSLRHPNDKNLGNLILLRHQLRQIKFTLETDEEFQKPEVRESWDGRRIIQHTRNTIARLEEAIVATESALG